MSQQTKIPATELMSDFEAQSFQSWKVEAEKSLKGGRYEEKLRQRSIEGIELDAIYCRADLAGLQHLDNGSCPIDTEQEKNIWKINQLLEADNPQSCNEQLKLDQVQGINSHQLSFSRNYCLGLDPVSSSCLDSRRLSLATLDEFAVSLNGLDLQKSHLRLDCGTSVLQTLGLGKAWLDDQSQNCDTSNLNFGTDVFSLLAQNGSLNQPLQTYMDDLQSAFSWLSSNTLSWKLIEFDGVFWNSCGADVIQELSLAMATIVQYARSLKDLSSDELFKRFSIRLASREDIFFQIAAQRALRLLWLQLQECFGTSSVTNPELNINGSSRNNTVYDPWVNVLRASMQNFAAAAGGANSIAANSIVSGIEAADHKQRRLAANIQVILQEEAQLDKVSDPAAGSYYIENLTDSLAKEAWKAFQAIESKGGLLAALESGYIKEWIAESCSKETAAIESGRKALIGSNKFSDSSEKKIFSGSLMSTQGADMAFRNLNSRMTVPDINELDCKSSGVIDQISRAFKNGSSIGEISYALHGNPGKYHIMDPIKPTRTAAGLENLRDKVNALKNVDKNPVIQMVCFGDPLSYKARAAFIKSFFANGGFELNEIPTDDDLGYAAAEFIKSSSACCVICAPDNLYPGIVEPFVKELRQLEKEKASHDSLLMLAGFPRKSVDEYQLAGVQEFIHLKSHLLNSLQLVLTKFEELN
jgi:methylmalonyl-CoA mutase